MATRLNLFLPFFSLAFPFFSFTFFSFFSFLSFLPILFLPIDSFFTIPSLVIPSKLFPSFSYSFSFLLLSCSTAIRAWEAPIDLSNLYSFFLSSFSNKKIKNVSLLNENILHASVFKYIEKNNLYFYSPQARRKRFYRRILSVSVSLVAVASIFLVRSRIKYK